jgi:serine/threonine protein kinase/Tol biopolymer transport system component
MALDPGTRLGPYEVIAAIGSGGMGEVYRARDTKLGRDVALKILPDVFASDRERLARFEREAKTLASLNHPNIAQIYGIEDGPSTPREPQGRPEESRGATGSGRGDSVRALVMELVPGRTLDEMIAGLGSSGLSPESVLPIAKQIADALEAAHEAGIVHRDLKPANIKVRDDGTVKVLDFGLAKGGAGGGTEDRGLRTEDASAPTMTSPAMTQQGFILGTAAYMAPEQAKGKPVDRRADIWAFGVVLYEMLTRRRLFAAETVSETLAAVLRQEIDLAPLPADTPAAVRRLLGRCLDRDPRTRLRDIGEARVVLSAPMAEPAAAAAQTASPSSRWPMRLAWLGAGLMVGAGLWAWIAPPAAATTDDRPPTFTLRRLTEIPGPEVQPDISPDGRQVLYTSGVTGNRDIYLLRVGGARAINLTQNSAADDEQGRFSPNGDQIVFRSGRDGGGLFVMGATGESVRRLTSAGYDPAWSPDGRVIAYSTEAVDDPYSRNIFAELWTVEVASGKTTRLYAVDAVQPAWSPDGARIAFWANTGGQRDIWTIAATGGAPEAVTKDAATDWSPEWSPDGRWLCFESDRGGSMNVWRVPIEQRSGRLEGEPQPLTSGVRGLGYGRFSHDGTRMVVMGYDRTYDITVAGFDGAHPDQIVPRTTLRNQTFGLCHPSPDGTWLACTSRGAQEDLVILRADGTETRRLMDDPFKDRRPTWSPDGKTIGFYSTRSGRWETWAIQADGSDLRQITSLDKDTGPVSWSPDGRSAIVSSVSTHTVWRFDPSRLATMETAESLKALAAAGLDVLDWSPSGTLLAGVVSINSSDPAKYGVWDLAAGALRVLDVPIAPSGDLGICFLPDSRRVLLNAQRGLMLVDLADGTKRVLRPGEPQDLYLLSRDGRTLLIQRRVFDSDVWLMEFR